jgi:hypothetical protein
MIEVMRRGSFGRRRWSIEEFGVVHVRAVYGALGGAGAGHLRGVYAASRGGPTAGAGHVGGRGGLNSGVIVVVAVTLHHPQKMNRRRAHR